MANITLSETPGTTVPGFSPTIRLIDNTNTGFISPSFSSVDRVISSTSTPINYHIESLDEGAGNNHSATRGFLRGRRPHRGLQFPRGYYNK